MYDATSSCAGRTLRTLKKMNVEEYVPSVMRVVSRRPFYLFETYNPSLYRFAEMAMGKKAVESYKFLLA